MTEDKPARPWDVFNKNLTNIPEYIPAARMGICQECPQFIKLTKQCKLCGCIMPLKTTLAHAECPAGKWQKVSVSIEAEGEIQNDGLPK